MPQIQNAAVLSQPSSGVVFTNRPGRELGGSRDLRDPRGLRFVLRESRLGEVGARTVELWRLGRIFFLLKSFLKHAML